MRHQVLQNCIYWNFKFLMPHCEIMGGNGLRGYSDPRANAGVLSVLCVVNDWTSLSLCWVSKLGITSLWRCEDTVDMLREGVLGCWAAALAHAPGGGRALPFPALCLSSSSATLCRGDHSDGISHRQYHLPHPVPSPTAS